MYCWLQISIDGVACPERIVIRLFDDKTPKTCANFRALCEGNGGMVVDGTNVPMTYKGSVFHRIIKKFMLQGGDYTNHNGTGGFSIYGEKFEDENFEVKCDRAGLLAMANAGKNTNGSQFFITTVPCEHLNNKHVVFGSVIRGMNTVRFLEDQPTVANDSPSKRCVVEDCGSIAATELPPLPLRDDGDTHADFPGDAERTLSDTELRETAEAIRKIGNTLFAASEYQKATEKYTKALRYLKEVTPTSAVAAQLTEKSVACQSNIAMCYLKLGRWDEAAKSASEALKMDPKSSKSFFRRGVARLEMKDFGEAKEDFDAVLRIEPDNADAKNKLVETREREKAHQTKMAAGFKKMFE